jgi:hypothetical protein
VTDLLTLSPGKSVTPVNGVHHTPNWTSDGIAPAPLLAQPAAEMSVGPGGVQLVPPHQSPQWLPSVTPVSVVVVELWTAVQVYVLFTPATSDALTDDKDKREQAVR